MSGAVSATIEIITNTDIQPYVEAVFKLESISDEEFTHQYLEAVSVFMEVINNQFTEDLFDKFNSLLSVYIEAYITQNAEIIKEMNDISLAGNDLSPYITRWENKN